MLGWLKKKFVKKEPEAPLDPASLKIPVAPRPMVPAPREEEPADSPDTTIPEIEESTAESVEPVDETEPVTIPDEEADREPVDGEEAGILEHQSDIPNEKESLPEAICEPEIEPIAEKPAAIADAVESFTEPETAIRDDGQPVIEDTDAENDEENSEPETATPETFAKEIIGEPVEHEIVDEIAPKKSPASGKTGEEADAAPATTAAPEKLPEQDEEGAIPDVLVPEDKENITPVAEKPASSSPTARKPEPKKKSLFTRLSQRLARTRASFTYQLDTLFLGKKEIDGELLDNLEELLITADLGFNLTQEILDHTRKKVKRKELSDPGSLKLVLKDKLKSFIEEYQQDPALVMPDEGPFVIMVVGVNGVGKTTTIGKIAHKFIHSGQSVLLIAADTFRAAAVSQLKIWGERNNVPVIAKEEGTDPSAVVYDGLAHARAKGYDVVLVDTAGRLHTQANLMEELKKIKRVMGKQLAGAPHEVMLVIDATTGQNGISQAKLFNEAVDLTSLTLTKLDGTAKGGIIMNICRELKLPIRFIGVGEQLDDLRDFEPNEFIEALFHSSDAVQQ